MKNSYLNGMLNFKVELSVIQNKWKTIVKKPRKIRRKIKTTYHVDCVERRGSLISIRIEKQKSKEEKREEKCAIKRRKENKMKHRLLCPLSFLY
jgi:hypothetical protein